MYKRNWRDIEPIIENDGNSFARYYFRRNDLLELEGGIKVAKYWEWVKYVTIPWNKRPSYKGLNLEKILFMLQGWGVIQSNQNILEVKAHDTVYVPPGTEYTLCSKVEEQPIIFMEYCVRAPPDSKEVKAIESTSEYSRNKILIEQWSSRKPKPGHEGTCYSYSIFTREQMKYFLFASMMCVPKVLGYHSHNSEAIYFIVSGKGRVKVAGEETEVCEGDAIYIPPRMAHRCYNLLQDQPLNVFCQGIADPYDAKVTTLENLPDLPV
ncbi:MAG: cupin domain-containing protein [Nitrososphaeria archaeon]|nr:cupin domain-containing protein [Nitrososphaeria archaeon]